MEHYKVVSSVALCAGMAIFVSAQGNTLATVPPAWQSGQFVAGEEIGEYIMATTVHPRSWSAVTANFNAAVHPDKRTVTDIVPQGWQLADPRIWAALRAIGPVVDANWRPGFGDVLASFTGGFTPEGKPKALPKWETTAPMIGSVEPTVAPPWAVWQALQCVVSAICADLVRAGAAHLSALSAEPTYSGGGKFADNPDVKGVLASWGFVPGTRYKNAQFGPGWGAFIGAFAQGMEDVMRGEGPRFPFDIAPKSPAPGGGYAIPGAGSAAPAVDPKEERRRLAALRLGVVLDAPAPSAGSAAALAAGAPATAVPVADMAKIRASDGTITEVGGDAGTILAAVELATTTGAKVALFANGVGLAPADRAAHLAALRAALPPTEDDLFA